MSDEAKALAKRIRAEYADLRFGICQFYGLGQMAPNDQSYRILSVEAAGDELSIGFQQAGGEGSPGYIRVQRPRQLKAAAFGPGFAIESADVLVLDESRVERKGSEILQTNGGKTETWPLDPAAPALLLTR